MLFACRHGGRRFGCVLKWWLFWGWIETAGAGTNLWIGAGGDWFDPARWSLGQVPEAGSRVAIPVGGGPVQLTHSTASLASLAISGALIASNWTTRIEAACLTIHGGGVIRCAGPFTDTDMSNRVYAMPTNTIGPDHGALIAVTGTVSLTGGSVLYPYSDPTNGGSVLIRAGSLAVASNSSIDAGALGFAGGVDGTAGWGPGGGKYWSGGGGYGGKGANANATHGLTYGDCRAPVLPGSGGGSGHAGAAGGHGGGLIRIEARDTIAIEGALLADGGNTSACCTAGGSGGGIRLTTHVLTGAPTGLISAQGGSGPTTRGGGGGRIAVWRNFDTFPGIVRAAGAGAGEPGTIVRRSHCGSLLMVH